MNTSLETASPEAVAQGLRRVAIDPVSRVEGHGKVTILLDAHNKVQQVRLHIVEFRGFEKFIEGRPYWEVPVMVQRLCGICPVSHHLAASKAFDRVLGVVQATPSADKIRRLMHYGQVMQSNALHFFHLSSPDLLFGFDSEVNRRNIVGVAQAHPDIAKKGIMLRKFGQEVIRATAGKRVHGTGSVPGGVNKHVSMEDRAMLLRDVDQMIAWAQDAVDIAKQLHGQNPALYNSFGSFRSNMLSLVRADGALDLYDGVIRARDADGKILFDGASDQGYLDLIEEEVKPWTYMKFPFLKSLGRDLGWYRVGPLARLQNCDFIPSPLAEAQRREFIAITLRKSLGKQLRHLRNTRIRNTRCIPHGIELTLLAALPSAAPIGDVHLSVVTKVDIGGQHIFDEGMLIDDFESRANRLKRKRQHL